LQYLFDSSCHALALPMANSPNVGDCDWDGDGGGIWAGTQISY
jgi:hypothetical protein